MAIKKDESYDILLDILGNKNDSRTLFLEDCHSVLLRYFDLSDIDIKILKALSKVENVRSIRELVRMVKENPEGLQRVYANEYLYRQVYDDLFKPLKMIHEWRGRREKGSPKKRGGRLFQNLVHRGLVEVKDKSPSSVSHAKNTSRRGKRASIPLSLTLKGRVVSFILDPENFDFKKDYIHRQFRIDEEADPRTLLEALMYMWMQCAALSLMRGIGHNVLELEDYKEEIKIDVPKVICNDVETSLSSSVYFPVFVLSSLVARLSPFNIWEACSKGRAINPLALVRGEAQHLPKSQRDALLSFLTRRYSFLLVAFAANIDRLNSALEAEYKE